MKIPKPDKSTSHLEFAKLQKDPDVTYDYIGSDVYVTERAEQLPISAFLMTQMNSWFGDLWIFKQMPAIDVWGGGQVVVPDVAGWRRERAGADLNRTAPNWVCEIMTDETEAMDRSLKMPAYCDAMRANGVVDGRVWLLSPRDRSLEIYQPLGHSAKWRSWALHGNYHDEVTTYPAPFSGVSLHHWNRLLGWG